MEEVSPGKHLGRLEILSLIQVSSAGQLFRARDTRDDKDVGVRVLPLEHGQEVRFGQRQYTIARLKHKNILSVRRLLSKPGISYVVSDPVRGVPLRQTLKQGPLPVGEVINIVRQVASALEAGHGAGVVHADLHPESIFVAPDVVQIVDYGFNSSKPSLTASKGSEENVGYLAPEVLKGEEPSAQSDLFSMGAILYEMLVGHKAFRGQTADERMHAVLEGMPEEPPARVPTALVALLERLLPVDPAQRLQSAAEVRTELEQIAAELAKSQPEVWKSPKRALAIPRVAAPSRFWSRALLWTVTALGALALGWAGARVYSMRREGSGVTRFLQITHRPGTIVRARISADGKTVVYTARLEPAPTATYVRTQDESDGRDLHLPDGSTMLALSKQGAIAVRLSNGSLQRIPLAGGSPEQIDTGILDADWTPDGTKLAVARYRGPGAPYRVEFPTGTVVHETRNPPQMVRVSPDGKQVAFTETEGKQPELWVARLEGAAKKLLTLDAGDAQRGISWSPDGREIWYGSIAPQSRGLILGVNLDGAKRQVSWMPESYLDDVNGDKALVESFRMWSGVLVGPVDDKTKLVDLSWHGEVVNLFLTAAGKAIFTEYGAPNGPKYEVFMRENAAWPALRIGEGDAVSVSPDGRSVCAMLRGSPSK
ncbi:MAG: serine/threonine-protein kinase, partial [Acidobacteriaceae bacterium]|nr:serine/threonine-protein kinase [Acidobacteriaceae bacterium]